MHQKLSKKPHIIFKEEENGAFLFDPNNGNLKFINRTGRELYLLLDNSVDRKQMIEILIKRYPETEPDQLETDVEDFIDQLEVSGFIVSEETNQADVDE